MGQHTLRIGIPLLHQDQPQGIVLIHHPLDTLLQSLPVNGVIVVTSPQALVSMIVEKALNMAQMMNVPVYGFVENYSYLECPDCGKRIEVFGKSRLDEVALAHSLPVLARLPIDPETAAHFDAGEMERVDLSKIMPAATLIEKVK